MKPPAQLTIPTTGLPIEAARAQIEAEVANGSVVIRAEPGAGKSSLVPLFVAHALGPDGGSVIVTEPRRLAVRATAGRLAELLGEPLGKRVGLTMRGERITSGELRIEVVTEAVLTNRLQRDPELPGVGAVIFDEFHERHLHSDLGLAMTLEARSALREDLRIVVMSATLDTERLQALVGAPTMLDIPGRTFEVTTHHLPRPDRRRFADAVVSATARAADTVDGDVLVFVPGRREIDDAIRGIGQPGPHRTVLADFECLGLHGSTAVEIQRSVLRGGRRRRIIVATSVAETSITVPGVEAVVDGGLLRRARFDPTTGLGRLDTGHATRFAADQRRGRAGRLAPGHCFRLWSAEDHRHLDDATPPEIVDGDPLPIAFELARWGDPWADTLPLLDHPGRPRLEAAQRILALLGLTDPDGRLTADGERAADLGLHPRLAALTLAADAIGQAGLGLRTAALLDDDSWPQRPDLAAELDRRWGSLEQPARRLGTRLGASPKAHKHDLAELGALLARAWPDRIAMARPDRPGRFLLAIGREVVVDATDPLANAPFIVVAEADGNAVAARVRRGVAIDRTTVLESAEDRIEWVDHVDWDQRADTLRAETQQRLGSLVLHRNRLDRPPAEAVTRALIEGLHFSGLDLLRWGARGESLRLRLRWLHEEAPDQWPDLGDAALLDRLDEWLDVSRCRSIADLRRVAATDAMLSLLGWEQRQAIDTLAPASLKPPAGRERTIHYGSGRPVWSVRIQHLFGLDAHPTIGPNDTPLTIELLSPANRPAQVTTDLPGFWRGSYAAVRADLRGRYPKHAWPEQPWRDSAG